MPKQSSPPSTAGELTIRQLCERLKTTLRTARFYEAEHLLAPRRVMRARYYSSEDVQRFATILFLRRCGFAIAEIRELLRSSTNDQCPLTAQQCEKQIAILKGRRREINAGITELKMYLKNERVSGASARHENHLRELKRFGLKLNV